MSSTNSDSGESRTTLLVGVICLKCTCRTELSGKKYNSQSSRIAAMTRERWQKIEEIYHEALERPAKNA
jgi:hypothetical protein